MKGSVSTPRIAVLLPVYNGGKFLAEAVDSVLRQTFADFELLAIDDGSTDVTAEILGRIRDPRLRILRFAENRGLVEALNAGIRETRSELIARMDADDICLPERFARQVAFLDAHPEVGFCGTWMRTFGAFKALTDPPVSHEGIRASLFFCFALAHPTLMMRRAVQERHGLWYNDEFRYAEDLDLFLRAAEVTRMANIPEVLALNRIHGGEISAARRAESGEAATRALLPYLRALVPKITADEERFHFHMYFGDIGRSVLPRAEEWLLRLDGANRERKRYDEAEFRRELRRHWYLFCAQTNDGSSSALVAYWKSPLASLGETGWPARAHKAGRSLRICWAGMKNALRPVAHGRLRAP